MHTIYRKKIWTFGLLILLALGSAAPAFAQSIWIDKSIDRAIYLEIQKPSFTEKYLSVGGLIDPPPKSTFATSNWYLSARWRVGGLLLLRAELPFVNAGLKKTAGGTTISNSENQFGNPFVGMELGRPGASSSGEIGVRLPVVDDEHAFSSEFGTFTDYDRFEAFLPKMWTFTSAANVRLKTPTGFLLQLRAGPALFVPTESGVDVELFGDYGLQAGYQSERVTVLGGLTGRGWLTESDLGNRFVDQIGLAASYAFDSFIPGVHFRAPLDKNLDDVVSSVVGINLGYRLP